MSAAARRLPADQTARRRAATDLEANLVVLAGAGTGKTSLLVERLLTGLGSARLELGRVAAITFTEKAAAEMRQRLARGLESLRLLGRGEEEPDPARSAGRAFLHLTGERGEEPGAVADRAVAALAALEGATVTTLHGFCSELLRRHPFEAGVDPHFTVDTGERFEALLDEEWERFLAEELGPGGRREKLWRPLLDRFSLAGIHETARELAGFDVPLRLLDEPRGGGSTAELFTERAGALASTIEEMLARQEGMAPLPLRFFPAMARGLRSLEAGGIPALAEACGEDAELAAMLGRDEAPKPGKKLVGVDPDELKSAGRESLRLLRGLVAAEDEILDALVEAVAPFARRVRERFLRRGYLSFDALLTLARDLLRDHPEIRGRLKRRYDALLVDEFQDTDPVQYEIVLLLGETVEGKARSAFEAELAPGRLFVVGDPKQSIYRFRGADYQACLRAVRRIEEQGGAVLDLTANFRGRPGALQPVNLLFEGEGSTWRESAYQPPYLPIDPFREEPGGAPRVELWTVLPPEAGAAARRLAEGRVLGREIRRLVDESTELGFGGISVLLRSFTDLGTYLRGLREWDVPFVVDGGKEFLERPEVAHLLSVLRALVSPADPVALLAYLRSPAGGVPDTELAAYAAAGGPWDRRAPVDGSRFPAIAAAIAALRDLEEETRDLPADALVRRALERTRLLVLDAAAFEGAQRVANLRKLAATAAELARDGSLSLSEVLDALALGRGADLESNSPLADETTDAVRVVTVHKAKGLQNEVIFVPDLARRPGGSGSSPALRLARLPDGSRALGLGVEKILGSVRVWIDQEGERHEKAEGIRVLYVALTRARERLVLLAGNEAQAAWIQALRPWSYGGDSPPGDGETLAGGGVLHRLMEPPGRGSRRPAEALRAPGPAVERFEKAVLRLREGAGLAFRPPSGLREKALARREEGEPEDGLAAAPPPDTARVVGLVAHRLLETWNGREEELRESLAELSAGMARAEGAEVAAVEAVEKDARAVMESFLSSPLAERFRALLGRGALLGRELPILLRRGGDEGKTERFRGFLDLLYRDEEGGVVVADYKTDLGLTPDQAKAHYREQLAVYAEAVAAALGLPSLPRTELWMLRSGEIIPVELS